MKEKSINPRSVPDAVAWKAMANLTDKFHFDEKEGRILLGDMPRSSYLKGIHQHQGNLSRDRKERISLLLGIYKALKILFIDSAQALSWIDRPNSLLPFNGMTPRDYLLEGSFMRLAEVRKFLDFWRG